MSFTVPKNTPGPSPWYLRDCGSPAPGFRWRDAGDGPETSGKTLLVAAAGVYAILGFQNYVLPLSNGRVIVWHQRVAQSGPTEPVVLTVLQTQQLSPLSGSESGLCKMMKERDLPLLYDGEPEYVLRLDTTAPRQDNIEFPEPLSDLDELLILCHSSHAQAEPSWETSNLALLIARPRLGRIEIYPQDWFNTGGLDYGYQWVTRVARDPHTGRIHGEGIRISSFVLNEDLRSLSV